MAINKTFVAHTELKAQDLNDLVSQANGYVGQIDRAKPNTVDIAQYNSEGAELPLASYYVYYGNPTHALAGRYADTDTYFIAVCISHWELSHAIVLYVKNEQNKYIYSESFRSDQASSDLEKYIAGLFAGAPVTYDHDGLMKSEDKQMFDDMVPEVFPVKVAIASSNAGTYEVGDAQHSVTPQIVLSITRKGADVSSSATVAVTPSGTVGSNNKTITDSAIFSSSKTYHIEVTQGGQTVSPPNQRFDFKNYLYKGSFASSQKATVKANLVSAIKSKTKVLSDDKTLGQTTLAGGDCYLFAVKGHVNLVVKNAKSGGTISVDSSDKGFITDFPQENNPSLTNEYSWIIVPASSNTWYFQITNS